METGSYHFDSFIESHKEMERLLQQAAQMAPFEQALLQTAGLKTGMRALDVGCGPGLISGLMATLVGDTGAVIGIDLSDDLLAVANEIAISKQISNVQFKKMDIYDLDLPPNSFDFIYLRLVFQHLAKPQIALQKLLETLKPNGVLCLADIDDRWLSIEPEPAAFQSLVERSAQWQSQQGGDRFVGHKLGVYMGKAGFTAVDVKVIPITSQMIGMKNFLEIGLSFRAFATANDEERASANNELQQLESLIEMPHAWGFLAIFVATGKKTAP